MGDADGSSLKERIEKIAKAATASVVLVAAIGFPAVVLNLRRYGAPATLMSYDDVVRAGILPAVVLVVLFFYTVMSIGALSLGGWRGLISSHVYLFLPASILVYVAQMVCCLCLFAVATWGLLWLPRSLMETFLPGHSVTNRQLMMIAGTLDAVAITALVILWLTRKVWIVRPGRPWEWVRAFFGDERDPGKNEMKWYWPAYLPASILIALAVKVFLWIWDPRMAGLASTRSFFVVGLACGLLSSAFMFTGTFYAKEVGALPPGQYSSKRQRLWLYGLGILVYVTFECSYSLWGYPRLSSAMGGGRPDTVTLWMKRDEGIADLNQHLPLARIVNNGAMVRVDGIFTVIEGKEGLLLTDQPMPPRKALLVAKRRIMATSW